MAKAYTIPIEINEEALLHSDAGPAPVPAAIQATLDVSLEKRERYERHAWHIEADDCKAAQDTAPLHPIQDIQHVPIAAHPVVRFD